MRCVILWCAIAATAAAQDIQEQLNRTRESASATSAAVESLATAIASQPEPEPQIVDPYEGLQKLKVIDEKGQDMGVLILLTRPDETPEPEENTAPVITSLPSTSANVDSPYSYRVIATDVDEDDVVTYSLVTKPTGMTINASTGVVAWAPSATGTVSVTVRATDAEGAYDEQSWDIVVAEALDWQFSHIKTGIFNYWSTYVPAEEKAQSTEWTATHADFITAGVDPTSYSDKCKWMQYINWPHVYLNEGRYKALKEFASTNGYTLENFFIHMKEDFTTAYPWVGIDKFGFFELADGGAGNGVLTYAAGAFTDRTSAAYGSGTFALTDYLYLGYDFPFDEVNIAFSAAGVGVVGEWQYWNGSSWTTLSVTDGTSSFTANGAVTFTPPSDWTRTVVNSSWSKYFVRYATTSASTYPVFNTIKGDDWSSSVGTHNCRGWDATDENVINSGELRYNPTPPANATARFIHQSKAIGDWSYNQAFMNPSYMDGDTRLMAAFLAEYADAAASEDADGIYWDVVEGSLTGPGLIITSPSNPIESSDFTAYTENSWADESLACYLDMRSQLRALRPGYLVGCGTERLTYAYASEWALAEYFSTPTSCLALDRLTVAGDRFSYDAMLAENNESGSYLLVQHHDIADHNTTANLAFWDRSNRGPMTSLSLHYICCNEYTIYGYHTFGGYKYHDADDIWLWDGETTLTSDISADTTSATKHIYGTDFSSFPSSSTAQLGYLKYAKIGDNVIIPDYTKVDNTHLTTTRPIPYDVASGATIKVINTTPDRMSNYDDAGPFPATSEVHRWGSWFPAIFYDVGIPNASGWNSGVRGIWATGQHAVWRRDYTNAIIVCQDIGSNISIAAAETYSTFDLGANYQRLNADSTLDDPISELRLRPADGAILIYAGQGPTISTATINAAGSTLTIGCSEAVVADGGATGFTLSGTQATLGTGVVSGSTITFALSGTVFFEDTVRLTYTQGNVTDASDPALALNAEAAFGATNNSTVESTPLTVTIASTSSNMNTSDDDRSLEIAVPTGTTEGDMLVAAISCLCTRTVATPIGWTLLEHVDGAVLSSNLYVFYKLAEVADESGSFTFSGSSTFARMNGVVMRITNHVGSIDSEGQYASGTSANALCPDIDVAEEASLVLSIATSGASDSTCAYTTEVYDQDNATAYHLSVYSEIENTSGTKIGRTIVLNSGQYDRSSASVAIAPERVAL
jgi:hypothetical protein